MPPEQVFKTLVARGDRGGVCLRGTQILLAPGDYLRATRARVGRIAKEG